MEEEEEQQDDNYRQIPLNELDFNSQLANPLWGNDKNNAHLRGRLSRYVVKLDKKGQPLFRIVEEEGKTIYVPILEAQSEYDNLSFMTRDLRLGNLNSNEKDIVRHWIELAHDALQYGLSGSHIAALSRAASILEISQSKGGFLRRQMNTLRQESTYQELEPAKKKLFGGKDAKQI